MFIVDNENFVVNILIELFFIIFAVFSIKKNHNNLFIVFFVISTKIFCYDIFTKKSDEDININSQKNIESNEVIMAYQSQCIKTYNKSNQYLFYIQNILKNNQWKQYQYQNRNVLISIPQNRKKYRLNDYKNTIKYDNEHLKNKFNEFKLNNFNYKLYDNQYINKKIHIGDKLIIKGYPKTIEDNSNPFTFNFKAYLNESNISLRDKLWTNAFIFIPHNSPSNNENIINKIREYCYDAIVNHIDNEDIKGFILAMTIGNKEYLTQKIKKLYSETGVIHILAVSGLHIGILFALINFLLSLFLSNKEKSRIIKYSIIIICLIGYTILTGGSPSNVRATLMFSLYLISQLLHRPNNIQNSILISALFILLWSTDNLYSIGFQLSYLAVLGIIIFYKKIYELIYCKNKIMRFIWSITAMSISTQLTTFPIAIYYFHQFPVYFILANLVIIPISGILFTSGLLLIITYPFDFLNFIISKFSIFLITMANHILELIRNLPYHLITDIYISKTEVIIIYSLIICSYWFLKWPNIKTFVLTLLMFFAYGLNYYNELQNTKNQNKLICYNVYPHWAFSYIKGDKCILVTDKFINNETIIKKIKPSLNGFNIKETQYLKIDKSQLLTLNNTRILIQCNKKDKINKDLTIDYSFIIPRIYNVENVLKYIKAKIHFINTNQNYDFNKTIKSIHKPLIINL